jgi:hypothetical protein
MGAAAGMAAERVTAATASGRVAASSAAMAASSAAMASSAAATTPATTVLCQCRAAACQDQPQGTHRQQNAFALDIHLSLLNLSAANGRFTKTSQ